MEKEKPQDIQETSIEAGTFTQLNQNDRKSESTNGDANLIWQICLIDFQCQSKMLKINFNKPCSRTLGTSRMFYLYLMTQLSMSLKKMVATMTKHSMNFFKESEEETPSSNLTS